MTDCNLCAQGDIAIPVSCHNCQGSFHVHSSQLALVADETIVVADCPDCGAVCCWWKLGAKLFYCGPVVYMNQEIVDLRGKRG